MSPTLLHELALISPLLVISIGALLVMLLEVFLPPNWPRAGNSVRLPMPSIVSTWPVSLRMMTSWPSPPRHWPAPPLSVRSRFDSTVMWVSVSQISTGTTAMFEGCGSVDHPSRPFKAP